MQTIVNVIGALIFWGFIAIKAWGTTFAAWSWWWVLFPLMPWLGLAIQRLGL